MRKCSDCSAEIPAARKLNYCTACSTIRKRAWRAKNAEHDRASARKWRSQNPTKVSTYRERSREQRNANSIKWNAEHRDIVNHRGRKRRLGDLPKHMWKAAKARATAKNIPFDITVEDIGLVPDVCPILGIELKAGTKSINSPSLDRLVPSLGYVKGNIWIISSLANSIKASKTLEELKQNYESLHKRLGYIQAIISSMESFR